MAKYSDRTRGFGNHHGYRICRIRDGRRRSVASTEAWPDSDILRRGIKIGGCTFDDSFGVDDKCSIQGGKLSQRVDELWVVDAPHLCGVAFARVQYKLV